MLCSPSRRTRETLALLSLEPAPAAVFPPALYLASARTLLTRLRRLPPRVRSVLVIGHVADTCLRSPASLMANITNRTNGMREQVVMVMGGPGAPAGGQASLDACQGRSPHGFIEQEAEVAAGIARFVRGGRY